MVEDLRRQRVLKFLDAFYSGDIDAAQACCDDDFDSITYAPIELFPHLGHKHGQSWVAEAIRTPAGALFEPQIRNQIPVGRWRQGRHHPSSQFAQAQ
jgi:hypothetical protein